MKYLNRSIQVDPFGNWYNGYQRGTRKAILHIFDLWRYAPGPRIDLIRTPTGTPIYFEALDRGSWVCQIEYQPIVNRQNRIR